jgi:hypothetical protein
LKEALEILEMTECDDKTRGLSLSEKYFLAKDDKLVLENKLLKLDVEGKCGEN